MACSRGGRVRTGQATWRASSSSWWPPTTVPSTARWPPRPGAAACSSIAPTIPVAATSSCPPCSAEALSRSPYRPAVRARSWLGSCARRSSPSCPMTAARWPRSSPARAACFARAACRSAPTAGATRSTPSCAASSRRDARRTPMRCCWSASVGSGRVVLVGAGPGDPDLITLRGLRWLRQADVVIYDQLASPALLDEASPDALLIFAGKATGNHCIPQSAINALLIHHAEAGRLVVRLKGGDPFVFGRGGEEVLACRGAGIPVEVVPGVSSAVAVPAAAGIPVTYRG